MAGYFDYNMRRAAGPDPLLEEIAAEARYHYGMRKAGAALRARRRMY